MPTTLGAEILCAICGSWKGSSVAVLRHSIVVELWLRVLDLLVLLTASPMHTYRRSSARSLE
jgi:hypothetical protein